MPIFLEFSLVLVISYTQGNFDFVYKWHKSFYPEINHLITQSGNIDQVINFHFISFNLNFFPPMQDRDKIREEVALMKDAFQLSKARYDSLENESKTHKYEAERFREVSFGNEYY